MTLLMFGAGTLTGRVPTRKLALSSMECQRGSRSGAVVDVEAVQWLQTDDGQRVLAEAGTLDEPDPLRARSALARACPTTSSALLAAALTQAELRRRAVEKFGGLAASMYFTPDGLEQ